MIRLNLFFSLASVCQVSSAHTHTHPLIEITKRERSRQLLCVASKHKDQQKPGPHTVLMSNMIFWCLTCLVYWLFLWARSFVHVDRKSYANADEFVICFVLFFISILVCTIFISSFHHLTYTVFIHTQIHVTYSETYSWFLFFFFFGVMKASNVIIKYPVTFRVIKNENIISQDCWHYCCYHCWWSKCFEVVPLESHCCH